MIEKIEGRFVSILCTPPGGGGEDINLFRPLSSTETDADGPTTTRFSYSRRGLRREKQFYIYICVSEYILLTSSRARERV